MAQPFPEEMNRVVVGRLSALHFAATPWAAANLRSEGVDASRITVTGNTGIDAVLYIRDRLERNEIRGRDWPDLDPGRKLIVVTAHRRESFGEGFEQISTALLEIAKPAGCADRVSGSSQPERYRTGAPQSRRAIPISG